MWRICWDRVEHEKDGTDGFAIPVCLAPKLTHARSVKECFEHQAGLKFTDVNTWERSFPRSEEDSWVANLISEASASKPAHIHHISSSNCLNELSELYKSLGYYDQVSHSYHIDFTHAPITCSVSLRHVLFSEKQKYKHAQKFHLLPPIRSSHDAYMFGKALREGLIMAIDVEEEDLEYLGDLIEQEILSPYQVWQVCAFTWTARGSVSLVTWHNVCLSEITK